MPKKRSCCRRHSRLSRHSAAPFTRRHSASDPAPAAAGRRCPTSPVAHALEHYSSAPRAGGRAAKGARACNVRVDVLHLAVPAALDLRDVAIGINSQDLVHVTGSALEGEALRALALAAAALM
eukprot:scaffold7964_cov403-Prasinococcus_capsulatus_cf.AAC.1